MTLYLCAASGSESEEGEMCGGEEGSGAKRRKKRMKRRGKKPTINLTIIAFCYKKMDLYCYGPN